MRMFLNRGILLTIFITFSLVMLAACSSPSATTTTTPLPGTYTVNIANKTGISNYLVDGNGKSLYYTTQDSPGVSNINDPGVLYSWPTFYTSNIVVSAQLIMIDFYSITRHDNRTQTAYQGWPLYYYINDKAPSDTNGDELNGVWFLARISDFANLNTPYIAPK